MAAIITAASGTPVVMVAVDYDPVALGYLYLQQIDLAKKRLELLTQALPSIHAATVFWDSASEAQWQATRSVATEFGLRLADVELRDRPYDYESALAQAPLDCRNVAIFPTSPVFFRDRQQLAEFALQHKIAAMFGLREWVDAGGLLSYGVNFRILYSRAAEFVDMIARGAKPADLPVEQPTKFELVLNLKTAKAIGITISPATDAEAICEAVTRANMRFVPTKTPEQQSGLMLHRTRHLFIRQQTSVINAIRAHLAEFGVIAPVGRKGMEELLRVIADPGDKRVPDVVRACLTALGSQLLSLKKQILDFDRMILAWHRSNQTSKRLNCIPGVGPLLATALVANVADPKAFRSGRNFSAWIGLVPKQHSSGGRDRLGSISKQGDRYLRSLFVAGALAVIRYAKLHGTKHRPWLTALLARRPTKVAAIALANKLARMAWAMMASGERYNYPAALRV